MFKFDDNFQKIFNKFPKFYKLRFVFLNDFPLIGWNKVHYIVLLRKKLRIWSNIKTFKKYSIRQNTMKH